MGSRECGRPRRSLGARSFNRFYDLQHDSRVVSSPVTLVGRRRRRFGVVLWLVAAPLLITLSTPASTHAVNSVFVESKTVLAGAENVHVRIRITNGVTLNELRVPLELRSTEGGAFPIALSMSYDERLAGSVMSETSVRRHYPERDGDPCNPLQPDGGYFTYISGITKDTVASSPEGVMFLRAGAISTLPPGSDGAGSMVLTLDIGPVTGSFLIDTTCIAPGTFFGFNDTVAVDFTPGVITVVATAPDTIFVDTLGNDELYDGTEEFPYATIQKAIEEVQNPQTVILVGPGIYHGPIHYPLQQGLTIVSRSGPFETAIVGDSSTSVVMMDSGNDFDEQVLDGFTIRDNDLQTVTLNGSGITVQSPTIGSIYNCIIANNSTMSGGAAGIEYRGSGGAIANCWIVDNKSTEVGYAVGGVFVAATSNVTMVNNTIARNLSSAGNGASGVFLDAIGTSLSRPGALQDPMGAGALPPDISSAAAVARFDNTIVAFNQTGYGVRAANPDDLPDLFHNIVYFENGASQAGIFDNATLILGDDPAFRDTAAGDYHITCASPARDAGNAAYFPPDIWTDIDGQPRLGPGIPKIDIGADEFFDDNKLVSFDADSTLGCEPFTVSFTNTSEICIDEGLRWDFGDGFVRHDLDNPIHIYEEAGIYTVKLVAEGLYADSVMMAGLIHVIAPPVADFTADTVRGCQTLTVNFEATTEVEIDQFTWRFGDGDTAVGMTAQHTYSAGDPYTVRLYSTNICGTDSIVKENFIRVDAPITASFSASPASGCVPHEVEFIAFANTDVEEFEWDFGDAPLSAGTTAHGDTVTHLYTQPGVYTVSLFARNNCGTRTVIEQNLISVGDKPDIDILTSHDPQNLSCNPYTVSFGFSPQDDIDSVLWEFSDDSTSTQFAPVHTYHEGGRTYSVRLIVFGECGRDTVVLNQYIQVLKRPTVVLSATPDVGCVGTVPVNFSAAIDGDADSSRWYFADGTSAPGPNVAHTYDSIATYKPGFKMWSVCGSDSVALSGTVTVRTAPVAAFSADSTTGYEPFDVHFINQSLNTPSSWHWDFGDGDTSVAKDPVHTYGPGLYTVTLDAINACGASTLEKDDYILVGGFDLTVDSTGVSADTILYSVHVTAELLTYPDPVSLSGALMGNPTRGSMSFVFSPASGVPPFNATAKAIPSLDLATGDYAVRITADDPARIAKTDSRSLSFQGQRIIGIVPADFLDLDSIEIGITTSANITIRNNAPSGSGISLVVDAPTHTHSGTTFRLVGNGGTLFPQQQLNWGIEFKPQQKREYTDTVHVESNDPAAPEIEYIVLGRGIGNQTPPVLTATQPDTLIETKIDDSIRVTFSKSIDQIPSDSVLIVWSLATGDTLLGQRRWVNTKILQFNSLGLMPPDDTIGVTVRAVITDTDGNFFDGNGDGFEQRSPIDDYTFTFTTGPGVYPGDTDADGHVNEADVLPLGRYWGLEGLRRTHARPGFTMQPAFAWDDRMATHADADGDGVIDEMDICPIADYFDREVVLPKAAVEAWMAEAEGWSGGIVGAMLAALDQCENASAAGKAILGQFLRSINHSEPVPREFSLAQNYPNPFNPTTVIEYTLGEDADVRLEVYNLQGQLVRILDAGQRQSGRHFKVWDGHDANGHDVASGVYFYRLIAPNFQYARKMVLLR